MDKPVGRKRRPKEVEEVMMLPTYSEARTWFEWLTLLTPSDLADSMGVDLAVAQRLVTAGIWHGVIMDTGDNDGRETIYEYVELPPGPREHPTDTPPEVAVGYTEVLAPRGLQIRFKSKSDSRTGIGGKMKRKERRYLEQQQARAQREK